MESILAIAREAGQRILEIYRQDFAVSAKADHSPVTAADLAAHHDIVDGLRALDADTPVLSEESASEFGWAERAAWRRYWLVDPLDGTRQFIDRNDEFTVNIALIEDGVAIQGIVHAPAAGTTWWGERGVGAWRDGTPIRTRTLAATPPVVALSRSHTDGRMATWLAEFGAHELMAAGSALKFGLVAEGRVDCYPRLGPTSEWDTAAGHCVVEAAGGTVTRLDGTPLRYNQKESLLNPGCLVCGDPGLAKRLGLRP
jgi:3'(2'), 5'-bisphosphate nucleotidase